LERGASFLTAIGSAASLLRARKAAQTLIEIWSRVATEAQTIESLGKHDVERTVLALHATRCPRLRFASSGQALPGSPTDRWIDSPGVSHLDEGHVNAVPDPREVSLDRERPVTGVLHCAHDVAAR
jgi:hypothetical protein